MLEYIAIRLRALPKSERGATAVEYGLLVALIAVGIIAAVALLRDNLNGLFGKVSTAVKSA